MQPPPGYSVFEGMVCRLRRSLYGLKQAPRAWFERFASVVTAASFSPSAHDPALFVHTSPRGRTLLLLYIDDMIITGDDSEYIAFVKARLRDQFLMTDLGPLRYIFGIEVSFTSDGFYISQKKYIQDLLARAALGMSALLRPLWSLMLSFNLLMVILLLIRRVIVILSGVLFILLSLVLTSLILFIFRVSLFLLLPLFTIVIFSVFFVIFMVRSLVVFSFRVLAPSSSSAIRMLRGRVILRIAVHFLLTVCFLVVRLLLGRRRNRQRFPVRVSMLSCVLWPC
uniref:Uncharacterized protein n=1 Tax=Avena sativa TaxID=4498 RepID=A0ACD5VHT9_AVESA